MYYPLFPSLHEIFELDIASAWTNAYSAADVSGGVPAEPFEDGTYPLLSDELAQGNASNIPDEMLCLFSPVLEPAKPYRGVLGSWPAPSLSRYSNYSIEQQQAAK